MPTFEKYTDGGLNGYVGSYYLRALSIYGLKDKAAGIAQDFSEGYLSGMFTGKWAPAGRYARGMEFRTATKGL